MDLFYFHLDCFSLHLAGFPFTLDSIRLDCPALHLDVLELDHHRCGSAVHGVQLPGVAFAEPLCEPVRFVLGVLLHDLASGLDCEGSLAFYAKLVERLLVALAGFQALECYLPLLVFLDRKEAQGLFRLGGDGLFCRNARLEDTGADNVGFYDASGGHDFGLEALHGFDGHVLGFVLGQAFVLGHGHLKLPGVFDLAGVFIDGHGGLVLVWGDAGGEKGQGEQGRNELFHVEDSFVLLID